MRGICKGGERVQKFIAFISKFKDWDFLVDMMKTRGFGWEVGGQKRQHLAWSICNGLENIWLAKLDCGLNFKSVMISAI